MCNTDSDGVLSGHGSLPVSHICFCNGDLIGAHSRRGSLDVLFIAVHVAFQSGCGGLPVSYTSCLCFTLVI